MNMNKKLLPVLATIAVVIFLGACYFFIYVPNNEKILQEHRFRILQNIDKNIQSKVESSSVRLKRLLENHAYDPIGVKKYIKEQEKYSKEKYTLSNVDQIPADFLMRPGLLNSKINITEIEQIGKTSTFRRINIAYDVQQFFKPLLPVGSTFEEYIIINAGKVVFETFPSGLKIINQDTLLNTKSGFPGSGIKNAKIGGIDYKIFVQPVKIGDDNSWIIAGLLSNKSYQTEKNQLPTGVVLFMLIFAFGILVIFPWIKLHYMGSKDRLTVADVILSILVAMLVMSLVFFAFIKYNAPLRPESVDDHHEFLANTIANAFEDEVKFTRQKLQQIDTFGTNEKDSINNKIIIEKNIVSQKINVSNVYLMNSFGQELFNWNTAGLNNPKGNYNSRQYFQAIKSGKFYLEKNEKRFPYYLDQVLSWSDGEFKSVLSIPFNRDQVLAMSFFLKSFKRVILPAGYQFVFIDKGGQVLYHSDSTKNRNENLVDEFSSKQLRSSLQASVAHRFNTEYYGQRYNAYIRPLNNLPYFIVILEDTRIKDTRDMEIFGFTLSMLFFFSAFFMTLLLCVFLASAKPSYFKKNLFDLGWIGPKITLHRPYALSSFANLMLIIILIMSYHLYNQPTFFELFFILLTSITLTTLFLNLILQNYCQNQVIVDKIGIKHKCNVTICLIVLLFIIHIPAYFVLDCFFEKFFLIEVLLILGGWLIFRFKDLILNFLKRLVPLEMNDFAHSFTLMVFSRLIISSGLPIMLFYIAANNYEQNLSTHYRQVQFANQLADRFVDLTPTMTKSIDSGKYEYSVYKDNLSVKTIDWASRPNLSQSKEDMRIMELFRLLRHYKSENAVNSDLFNYSHTADSSIYFNRIFLNTDSVIETYSRLRGKNQFLKITSARLNYRFPESLENRILYWFLFSVALFILYLIILRVIKKIFALNLPDTSAWNKIDDLLYSTINLNKSLFLIGSPGAGKLKELIRKIKEKEFKYSDSTPFVYNADEPEKGNVCIADLTLVPDGTNDTRQNEEWQKMLWKVLEADWRLIIINHFEYNIKDPATNHHKLNLLESLRQKRKTKVIIVSTIHPITFLDSFNEQQIKAEGKVIDTHDLERWHLLLGKYHIIFQSIDDASLSKTFLLGPESTWERTLKKETNYTDFLIDMQDSTLKTAEPYGDRSDQQQQQLADALALKLQRTSHYFYMYIWQSLTKEEKFLIYDLAEDGLVNSYDDHNLCILVEKGLIDRHDGTLKLFNKGFRNFILTSIGHSEAKKIKKEIRDKGNWSQLKTPLLLAIAAILVFLFASQHEAYSRLITYATALGAGIPTIIRLFSLFEKGTQKTG